MPTELLIVAVVVIALVVLVVYKKNRKPRRPSSVTITIGGKSFTTGGDVAAPVDKTIPTPAVGFGYKCMWFAVKTDDKNRVAAMLQLANVSECNWQTGIAEAYKGSVFVTPAVGGWTLACGWGLPHGDTREQVDEVKSILRTLSREFGEAQFFGTHRVVDCHCWMKATNGRVERAYDWVEGTTLVAEGPPTEVELPLNLVNTLSEEAKDERYFEREDIVWPDEELVMNIAEHWSINPTTLDERNDVTPGLGLLGKRR